MSCHDDYCRHAAGFAMPPLLRRCHCYAFFSTLRHAITLSLPADILRRRRHFLPPLTLIAMLPLRHMIRHY